MLSRRFDFVALSILLVAFALRTFQLNAQSLWYDEGLSVHLASLSLPDTLAQSAITDHPPLHALTLNLWMRLAGSSEFSARFASVFFGTLAVALTYTLGKRVGGKRVGALAAGLMSIAPMAVWYGQEARGYSLLTALMLIAVLAYLKWVNGDRRRRVWLAHVLACAAALYTHYFAAFPIAAMNLTFVVYLVTGYGLPITHSALRIPSSAQSSRAIVPWFLAQLAGVVLFLPWLPNALTQAASNATYFPGRVTWNTVVLDTWRAFAGGDFPHLTQPNLPPPTGALWLAAILLGLASPLIRRKPTPTPTSTSSHTLWNLLTLVALILVPLFLMSLLAWEKPKFAPRYLLPALPAFTTLAALGVDTLLRFRKRVLMIFISLPLLLIPMTDLLVTAQIFFDPPVARPDVRAVAAYIDTHDEPGDAILLVGGHQAPVFEYYYHGSADVIPLPPDLLPAAQAPLDWRVMPRLAGVAATHPRAWLVLWQQAIADPTGVVLNELESQANRLEVGQNFHEVSLLLFDLRDAQFPAAPQHSLAVAFAEPIRLVGYDIDSNEIRAGQGLNFALYFESSGPINKNYLVFTHLIGPDGSIAAQDDRIAGADSYPTALWAIGTLMRNRFTIHLPADLPAGTYRLVVGLWDTSDRLAVSTGGDAVSIATLTVK